MTTLITGGTVVSPEGATPMDVVVEGETIAALVPPGSALVASASARPRRTSTPPGCTCIPGGVDVHTHMELPFGGTNASDTFETGTRAAAWGGTTTIIDFAVQRTGERVMDGLEAWHAKADGNCAIDYGFHMILGGVDDDSLAAMDTLVEQRGHHQLQAVHGLPGRVLQRRRQGPAGDAEGVVQRRRWS